MDLLGLIILLAAAVALVARGLVARDGTIQFPFLFGIIVLGYLWPQFYGLQTDTLLPEGYLFKTVVFAAACCVAVYFGYRKGYGKEVYSLRWDLDDRALFQVAVILMIAGVFFAILVREGAEEATAATGGQWTGEITVYYFFSRLLTYGMVLAIVGYLRRPSKGWLFLVGVGTVFYIDRIVNQGRRSELAELSICILLLLWFHKRVVIPRYLAIAGALVAILFVSGVGQYRHAVLDRATIDWQSLFEIDFVESFLGSFREGGDDARNAIYQIAGTSQTLDFDYGLSMWNSLVLTYIPGQYIGAQNKAAFLIDFGNPAYEVYGFIASTGTTPTGFADSYQSFWYFGVIKYWIIAYIFGRLYFTAARGFVVAQILVLVLTTSAIQTATHSTNWLIKDIPEVVIFLLLPVIYARQRASRVSQLAPNLTG